MNKEKLLELLSTTIEQKCSIRLHFSQYQGNGEERRAVTKEDAQNLINQFADALGTENISNNEGRPYADDFNVSRGEISVTCSYIPSKEEKKAGLSRVIEKLEEQLAELKREEEELA
jgi:hypothetical protein